MGSSRNTAFERDLPAARYWKAARGLIRRARQEQERQLLFDYGDDQEWEEWQDCIWSPS
jgi:hypothetical protein